MHGKGACMVGGMCGRGVCGGGMHGWGACVAGVCVAGETATASYWNAFLFTSKNRDRTLRLCLIVKTVIVHFDFVYDLTYLFRIFLC